MKNNKFKKPLRYFTTLVLCLVLMPVLSANSVAVSEAGGPNAEQNTRLVLGFFPVVSTVALYKRFHPLREYLSEKLGTEVDLQTARDFATFKKRTDNREYDIVFTAPHFAIRAADSGKYKIRATLTSDVQQIVIVHKHSPVKDVTQLSGKKIATPPESALMTKMGIDFFNQLGLSGEESPEYIHYKSHNAANEAVVAGEVDAAIASTNIVKKAIAEGEPLRIIKNGLSLPNMATMVATDMDAEIGDQLVNILVGMQQNEQGREVLRKIAFPGYRAVSAKDYEIVRPYQ